MILFSPPCTSSLCPLARKGENSWCAMPGGRMPLSVASPRISAEVTSSPPTRATLVSASLCYCSSQDTFSSCHLTLRSDLPSQGTENGLEAGCDAAPPVSSGDSPGAARGGGTLGWWFLVAGICLHSSVYHTRAITFSLSCDHNGWETTSRAESLSHFSRWGNRGSEKLCSPCHSRSPEYEALSLLFFSPAMDFKMALIFEVTLHISFLGAVLSL